jgi:hypothetical protein
MSTINHETCFLVFQLYHINTLKPRQKKAVLMFLKKHPEFYNLFALAKEMIEYELDEEDNYSPMDDWDFEFEDDDIPPGA